MNAVRAPTSLADEHETPYSQKPYRFFMQPTLNLRPRERAGLVIAIVALAVALNPLNRQVRVWFRDEVVKGVPFWLDHLLFMVTLMVVVWGRSDFSCWVRVRCPPDCRSDDGKRGSPVCSPALD